MENSQDQPLPPGVHSRPNYSSDQSFPGHVQPSEIAPQYQSNYPGSYQFFPPPANLTFPSLSQSVYTHTTPPQYQSYHSAPHVSNNNTPYDFQQGNFSQSGVVNNTPQLPLASNGVDGGYQNIENTTSEVIQESDNNLPPKVNETAVTVSNASSTDSREQLNNARDIDIAAQDAVLREQVCTSLI